MTETREPGVFHIGEILTTVTGKYVCPTGLGGVAALIKHVTGESHMTHQLGRASEEIEPFLRGQFPWIDTVVFPPINNQAEVMAFLDHIGAVHGVYHRVERLPFGAYVGREPIAEFREMAPHVPIVQVDMGGEP